VIQANPGVKINFGEFSKLCGQKWQTKSEEDRIEFEKKASEVSTRIKDKIKISVLGQNQV